jgi:hypothetical protein
MCIARSCGVPPYVPTSTLLLDCLGCPHFVTPARGLSRTCVSYSKVGFSLFVLVVERVVTDRLWLHWGAIDAAILTANGQPIGHTEPAMPCNIFLFDWTM